MGPISVVRTQCNGLGSCCCCDMISASNLPLSLSLSNFEPRGCATCRVKNGNINANTTEKGIQLVTVKVVVALRRAKHTTRWAPDKKPNLQLTLPSPFVTLDIRGHSAAEEFLGLTKLAKWGSTTGVNPNIAINLAKFQNLPSVSFQDMGTLTYHFWEP